MAPEIWEVSGRERLEAVDGSQWRRTRDRSTTCKFLTQLDNVGSEQFLQMSKERPTRGHHHRLNKNHVKKNINKQLHSHSDGRME